MYMIGEVSPEMQRLVQVTRECRDIGIQAAQPWARLGDVGAAIQEHAEKNGYSVVRDLCGHGVGIKFHEERRGALRQTRHGHADSTGHDVHHRADD